MYFIKLQRVQFTDFFNVNLKGSNVTDSFMNKMNGLPYVKTLSKREQAENNIKFIM